MVVLGATIPEGSMFSFGQHTPLKEEDGQDRRKALVDRSSSHCGDENVMPPTPRGLGTNSSSGKPSTLQAQAFLQVRVECGDSRWQEPCRWVECCS